MNILYVGTLPPHPGGSAISGWQIINGLARLGHSLRALAPVAKESFYSSESFAKANPHVEFTRFPVPFNETSASLPAAKEYRDVEIDSIRRLLPFMVAQQRPDVILIGRETFAWSVPDIAKSFAVPCVLRVAGAATLGILSGTLPRSQAAELLQKYRMVDLLVTPARHMRASLNEVGISNVEVIPNVIDLERFRPRLKNNSVLAKLGISSKEVVISHISGLDYIKRPTDFIRACLLAIRRGARIVPLVIGDGPARKEMESICAEDGLLGRSRFVGWIDYPQIHEYYAISDVVVMPCERETQARVYLEAQACGKVLLASDIPASREVIEDGKTGILYPVGDIESLASQIILLAERTDVRSEIGLVARSRVAWRTEDFAIRSYHNLLNSVYEKGREGASPCRFNPNSHSTN